MGKNKILVRLENTFDKFDLVNPMEKMGQVEPKFINMKQFAKDFYLEANPDESEAPVFAVKELSLSGNQLAEANEQYMSKKPWIGEDDGSKKVKELAEIKKPADHEGLNVALEPQRIRLFEISYQLPEVANVSSSSSSSKKPNLKLKPK